MATNCRPQERTATQGPHVDVDFAARGKTRALVRRDGQALPATVEATDAMLEERLVRVDYDRFPGRETRTVGAVVAILDELVDLGVDQEGARHLWSPDSNLVWAVEPGGDVEWSYDLDADAHADKDARKWTHYVARERGWTRDDQEGDA
jgi:hypothetical protein